MIKEKNPNFKGLWVKYSDYEIIKVNNEFYIKPTKKAEYSSYDVFDYEKEILVDFLYIGREVNNYEFGNSDIQCDLMSTEEKYQNLVLNFVKKYGLLGDLTYPLVNSDIVNSGEVFVEQNHKMIKYDVNEYVKPFFADNKEIQNIDFAKGVNESISEYIYNDNPNGQPYTQIDRNKDYDLVFSREYSEKIARILLYAKLMYSVFSSAEQSLWTENEDKKAIYQMHASDFASNNVTASLFFDNNDNGKIYLDWNFNSLKQAIELIFAFNESNDRKEVKICKHCGKPFIAKNLNAEYDTASCRNVANVYKNRAKNRK